MLSSRSITLLGTLITLTSASGWSSAGTLWATPRKFEIAAIHGDTNALAQALDEGADPNAVIVKDWTALHWAAHVNDVSMIQLLLEKGANINKTDKGKNTPLMIAIQGSKMDAVQALINREAKINLKNSENQTALDIAKQIRRNKRPSYILINGYHLYDIRWADQIIQMLKNAMANTDGV